MTLDSFLNSYNATLFSPYLHALISYVQLHFLSIIFNQYPYPQLIVRLTEWVGVRAIAMLAGMVLRHIRGNLPVGNMF